MVTETEVMRKISVLIVFLFAVLLTKAQTYNNEWINFNQTYYKFKVGTTGLYRITQPALASIGLASTPAQNFQLWRNGIEVPVYTSAASGTFSVSDFIEFYGEMNDGKADKPLYKYDSLQMADKYSLYTDTASYFLTVHVGTNKRFVNTVNDVAGNVLPAETGFSYPLQKYYRIKQNNGYGVDYGEILYSGSYETAEGWTSLDQFPGSLMAGNSLYLDNTSSSTCVLDAVVAGNATVLRSVKIKLNGTTIADTLVNGFNIKRFHVTGIPLSLLSSGNANIEFVNAGSGSDKIVVAGYQFTYPHNYNFEGQSQFRFDIPAGAAKYIEITNFNFGAPAPVLLDLNNNLRFVGNVNGSAVRFAIPAAASTRSYVLLNNEAANINYVQNFTQRNFINYALPANQGNYVIISHPLLFDDGAGNNNVEAYRAYRSSAAGGSYNAIVVDVNQLIDQFAFGIKHHPSAIRNFGYYAMANFSSVPKYFYLVGKGLAYPEFKKYESDPNTSKLALVPTFGYPASDNLLLAQRTSSYSQISIGRLSAISGTEVGDYLNKVKQFELAQVTGPQTNANKGWMKNVAQITGAIDDVSLAALINFFMGGYKKTLSDTAFGGNVYSFNKNSGQYTAVGSNKTIDDLFAEGLSYLTYFGHSSPNTLEFNLDNPQNYNNTGKYPLIMVNGCNSGNLFLFDTLRSISKGTLSEKYIFANNKGGIGFIADTHFGLPQQLNFFTDQFDLNLSNYMYGQPIGDVMRSTMQFMIANYSNDYASRIHAEEITFHGDPALKLNPFAKPDYTIEDSLISFNPASISVADEQVTITAEVLNIGKAINDSLTIMVQHQLPDNSIELLATRRIKATAYSDTIQVIMPINPIKHKGLNKVIVTIDPQNLVPELSETNNTVTKEFTIREDEIRPVFPYDYSIVGNSATLALYGSTANPLAAKKQYVMEMDTTRKFNSAAKVTRNVTDSGGVIKFVPGVSLIDSTVYYWRLATGPVTGSSSWTGSSFMYINGAGSDGYGQGHYYQYTDNKFESITLDSNSSSFIFDNKTRKLFIRTGLAPYYGWDQINVNVDNDQLDLYGCTYSIQFVVYNPLTLTPWRNYNMNATEGRFRSNRVCQNSATTDTTRIFFEYYYSNSTGRKNAMDFIDSIPNGYLVSVTNINHISNTTFIDAWKADTTLYGSGKSLWHKFHQAGMHKIDSFTTNLPFLFLFKKGDTVNFTTRQHIGPFVNSQIADTFLLTGKTVNGTISSPWFGPAKSWKRFKWDTKNLSATNQVYFDVMGQMEDGSEDLITSVYNLKDTALTTLNAQVYPKLRLVMHNSDPQNAVPAQLKYWMLTSDNYPEGALSSNLYYSCADTLTTVDSLKLKVAFKNISEEAFDSIRVRLTLTGADGLVQVFENLQSGARLKPLQAGDTTIISYSIPLNGLAGNNLLKLEVNPDSDQPEQFHFNNILYKSVYVNNTGCAGSTMSFTAAASAANMQWQVNTGSGFVNISNGLQYNGVNNNILQVLNAASNMMGYRYRLVYTTANSTTYSDEFVLKYTAVWNGAVSTAWENPANWACGSVPDANTDVIIGAGMPRYPVINSNAACHSLSASPSANLLVKAGFSLLVTGK